MTVTPGTLRDLTAYWTEQGGVFLGVVGNQRHCYGYHLGSDRIFGTCACKPDGVCVPGRGANDYSVQTLRDRTGLSGAASAIDLGRLDGSLTLLRRFSDWLARQCLDGAPGTEDIREVIYSPDGDRVLGFKAGVSFLIPGYGDASHRTHTHISYFRDSQYRDKRPVFRRYFLDPPDTSTPEVERMALIYSRFLYDVPAGLEFYEAPGGSRIGSFGTARTVESVGVPMDESADKINFRWLAVIVNTKAINDVTQEKIVYVEAHRTSNRRPVPAPVTTPDVKHTVAVTVDGVEAWRKEV